MRRHLLDWWERKQTVFENLAPDCKRTSSSPEADETEVGKLAAPSSLKEKEMMTQEEHK